MWPSARRVILLINACVAIAWAQSGPLRLYIKPNHPLLVKGANAQLSIEQGFFTSEGTAGAVGSSTAGAAWSSTDSNIASINSEGLLQANNVGMTVVGATRGPAHGSTTVVVTASALTSISITPSNSSLPKGVRKTLIATGSFADGTTLDITDSVTWSSSDSSIAAISNAEGSQGKLYAKAQGGPVTIMAAYGTVTTSTSITVTPPVPVAIAVTPTNVQAAVGMSRQFTATATLTDGTVADVTNSSIWSSSDGSLASVSSTGFASAIKLGAPIISCTNSSITGSTTWTILPGPTKSKYIRTTFPTLDFFGHSGVYDPARKLLFVPNPTENKIDMVAGPDYHLIDSIPVQFPSGIDMMADESHLLVCGWQGLSIIDPDTLRVIKRIRLPFPASYPSRIVSLSSGKALLFLQNLSTGVQEILEWDSADESVVQVSPPSFGTFNGAVRSFDHSKALILFNSGVYLFDAVQDRFTESNLSEKELPIAANQDGSEFVVGLDILDGTLSKIGTLPESNRESMGATFSRDGSHIYITNLSFFVPRSVDILDSKTFALVGQAPSFAFTGEAMATPFDIDENGILFGWGDSGINLVDVSKPEVLGGNTLFVNAFNPPEGPTNESTTTVGTGAMPASLPSVWFGSNFAPNVAFQDSQKLNISTPALNSNGPVNVTSVFSDDSFSIAPEGFNFGPPTILNLTTNAGTDLGGTQVAIIGYGLEASPSVTVGGRPAAITNLVFGNSQSFPFETLTFLTPPGTDGDADIKISKAYGSVDIPAGFHYLKVDSFTNGSLYNAMSYDPIRQQLYLASTNGNIDVFSLTTSQFLLPIQVGGNPVSLATSLDGSKLVAADFKNDQLDVIDLTNNSVVARLPATDSCFSDSEPYELDATNLDTIFVAINGPNLGCINVPISNLRILDLKTLKVSTVPQSISMTGMASSTDGSEVLFSGDQSAFLWRSSSGFVASQSDVYQAFPPAISSDGEVLINSKWVYDSNLQPTSVVSDGPFDGPFSSYPFSDESLDPTGALLYNVADNRIDVFDSQNGAKRWKIGVAAPGVELAPDSQFPQPLIIDENETRVFAKNPSGGFYIVHLPSVPLAIGSVTPTQAAITGGALITIRGTGFLPGCNVAFDGVSQSTTFVNSTTLQATLPSVNSGFVRISITSPTGESFSTDTLLQAF